MTPEQVIDEVLDALRTAPADLTAEQAAIVAEIRESFGPAPTWPPRWLAVALVLARRGIFVESGATMDAIVNAGLYRVARVRQPSPLESAGGMAQEDEAIPEGAGSSNPAPYKPVSSGPGGRIPAKHVPEENPGQQNAIRRREDADI